MVLFKHCYLKPLKAKLWKKHCTPTSPLLWAPPYSNGFTRNIQLKLLNSTVWSRDHHEGHFPTLPICMPPGTRSEENPRVPDFINSRKKHDLMSLSQFCMMQKRRWMLVRNSDQSEARQQRLDKRGCNASQNQPDAKVWIKHISSEWKQGELSWT